MRFNSQNSACFSKRPVFDSVDPARCVEMMLGAAELPRRFGRRCTLEKRTFFTNVSRAYFCARFSGCLFSKFALPNFFANFRGSFVFPCNSARFFVAFAHMFVISKALKVLQPIVGFVFVNVMDVAARYVLTAPRQHDHAMNKIMPATQVAVRPATRYERLELSKNFPATGYSVSCVKNAVVNTVKFKRNHVFSC
jgi:hypothetical protein